MDRYIVINKVSGFIAFLIAFTVYMLTLQPGVSFWDCGEFIASAYKLQVGHEPGAPAFMMAGKVLSLIASDPKQVAFWVNVGSALASAGTIMFLFWSVTALALKSIGHKKELGAVDLAAIIGAGFVGALAYAFSDSFWFSAVEAEVYALSTLCTAVVFWAILKWDALADKKGSDRWLVFIAFILGLSIGIHLLSLLAVPAIVLVYYFRKNERVTKKGLLLAFLAGCGIVGFIQYGIIQYLVLFAAQADLFFVNTLHLAFGSGLIFSIILIVGAIAYSIWFSHQKQKPKLNLALICISFILLGYSSYSMIYIRANAKTAINVSNPDNAFSLLGYLSRQQYGDTPLLYGPYFDSKYVSSLKQGKLYRKGDKQYEIADYKTKAEYDRNTLLPRIYSDDANHVQSYRNWLGMKEGQKASFTDNLKFLSTYQVGFMYTRYFLWNFAGKQNDEQGGGDLENGNWLTGIKSFDNLYLNNQENLSPALARNEGFNRYYGLPLIIGLIGLFYHFKRSKKDAGVVSLLFFCTGIAIILYLNQKPLEVRERDYAYVGSFYAFAIWIGLGALAVKEMLSRFSSKLISTGVALILCFLAAPCLMGTEGWNDHNRAQNYVAHDMAVNYLESCAPNAILFTNADNDTYPLWYAQEVEGVRRDVRIVNLQLLYNDSYIDQMKLKQYNSEPLPITMAKDKYVKGVRDVMPYVDYRITDSVELSSIFEVLNSDNENDKVEMQDGSKSNFLPSKNFSLAVDANQLLKTGTIKPEELSKVTPKMEWTYNKDFVAKSDLALMDIISHNNWNRPIYFTVALSKDSYFGLDNYLQLEGYAYRLLPFKPTPDKDKSEVTHNAAYYANAMEKFNLDSFNKAQYLDPESRRVMRLTFNNLNILAENLLAEGKNGQAKAIMNKTLQNLPARNYSITDSVIKYQAARNLYQLGEIQKANDLSNKTIDFLGKELDYYINIDDKKQAYIDYNARYIVSVLQSFKKEAEQYQQKEIDAKIQNIYARLEFALAKS